MLIDAHAHLNLYDDALVEAIEEIAANRIFTISNSTDISSYKRNLRIASECKLVLPAFGIHPANAPEFVTKLGKLKRYMDECPIFGEIGLDCFYVGDVSLYPAQREVFEFFLEEAAGHDKIVTIHSKGAENDVLHLLRRHGIKHAIIHSYSGPLAVIRSLSSYGYYFSIGIDVLKSRHVQEIARELPIGQILTETDNPAYYESLEGTIGMPRLINDVVAMLASLKETTVEQMMLTIQSNFVQLIRNAPVLKESFLKVCDELSDEAS